MFGQSSGEVNTFDITEMGYIQRIVVGTTPLHNAYRRRQSKQNEFGQSLPDRLPQRKNYRHRAPLFSDSNW